MYICATIKGVSLKNSSFRKKATTKMEGEDRSKLIPYRERIGA